MIRKNNDDFSHITNKSPLNGKIIVIIIVIIMIYQEQGQKISDELGKIFVIHISGNIISSLCIFHRNTNALNHVKRFLFLVTKRQLTVNQNCIRKPFLAYQIGKNPSM